MERNFAALSVSMSGIARKTALMRDKGDKLTQTLKVNSNASTKAKEFNVTS